ncbi:MAG: DNA adenine methylase, partial [Kiritimatiellia bacterium]
LFFDQQPADAVVNDSNAELINVYCQIRDSLDELIARLEQMRNTADEFYRIRQLDRNGGLAKLSAVERAARIIYLNKTCYNGLFRVNSQGEFNTPFGNYKNPNIVNAPVLRAVSAYLSSPARVLKCGDYAAALTSLRPGAFVYFDPPYAPISRSASFTGYTEKGFDVEEQERLCAVCKGLDRRGVRFMLSNSDTVLTNELYKGFVIEKVVAKRSVNSDGSGRGEVPELIVRNYENEHQAGVAEYL